ncbi:MAG: transposase [Thermoanaerobaculia bacterium]
MARPLRFDHPGAVWHLTSRGNEQRMILLDHDDRLQFLALLAATIARFRWILHEFVLMGNHYHLVAEMTLANVSRGGAERRASEGAAQPRPRVHAPDRECGRAAAWDDAASRAPEARRERADDRGARRVASRMPQAA